MPDGSVPRRWINPRSLPKNSRKLAAEFWSGKPDIPKPPIEFGGVCHDPAPDYPHKHTGAGIEHTIGEYTRRACGITKPTQYPTLTGDETHWLTVHDPDERCRQKEQNRKRVRSHMARDGVAPYVDPSEFKPEHHWAVDLVNFVALKRFSPPDTVATNARGQTLTRWLGDIPAGARGVAVEVFRRVAKGHGGGEKVSARTIISDLLTRKFAGNMQGVRVVPTPNSEGRDYDTNGLGISPTSENHHDDSQTATDNRPPHGAHAHARC